MGKAEVLRQGRGLMMWAYGAMVSRAWEAIEQLGDAAADVTLINARFAKPFDSELLKEPLQAMTNYSPLKTMPYTVVLVPSLAKR